MLVTVTVIAHEICAASHDLTIRFFGFVVSCQCDQHVPLYFWVVFKRPIGGTVVFLGSFLEFKVNSVQEACTKCLVVHI